MSKYYSKELNNVILNGVDKNTFDFINEATSDNDDLIAITYFNNKISYKKFKEEVYKYATVLKNYGLGKGDTISLLLPNVPEIVYYYYAAWILGVKVNPIDPRFNCDGILNSINQSDSKLLIAILDCYSLKVKPIINKINVENVILVSPSDSMPYDLAGTATKFIYKYKDFLLNLNDKDFNGSKVKLNDVFVGDIIPDTISTVYEDHLIASNLFTSGTTGNPKAAQLSHRAFNIKANQIKYGVPNLNPGDSFLAIIPFFSGYGSFAGMHNCLHKNMNLIMIPKFSSSEVSDLLCKYKASTMIGVPKYWEDFINNIEFYKRKYKLQDFSFLKNPVSGGDKINSEIVNKFDDYFKKEGIDTRLIIGYGSTETGGPISTTVADNYYRDCENTGVLFPGVEYIIINPDTNEIIEDNSIGELAIHDEGMMEGYENKEDTEAITINHNGKNFIKTGDLFEVNDREMLYFKGRVKRVMMRPDGHTVHSLPIENTILLHPMVDNCCVVGLKKKDNSSGTIPTAFIKLKEGQHDIEQLIKEIDDLSLQYLSERNRALSYVFVENLPYTSMGKIDYKSLEKLFIDDLNYYVVDDTFFKEKNSILIKRRH